MPVTVKLSDETMKLIGATEANAEEKISGLAKANKTLAEQNEGFSALAGEMKNKFEAVDSRLKAVEGREVKISTEDRTAIINEAKAEAKTVAQTETGAAIAKAGVQSVKGGEKADSGNGEQKAKPADDDYGAQWKADASLKERFVDLKSYEFFKKAEANGQVKISGKN